MPKTSVMPSILRVSTMASLAVMNVTPAQLLSMCF